MAEPGRASSPECGTVSWERSGSKVRSFARAQTSRCLGSWRRVWGVEEVIAQRGKGVPERVVLRAPELSTGVPHKVLYTTNTGAMLNWRITKHTRDHRPLTTELREGMTY